jgi:hypothetical protein
MDHHDDTSRAGNGVVRGQKSVGELTSAPGLPIAPDARPFGQS